MKPLRLDIPEFLRWSCHGCSQCCRGSLLIALSPEEKLRIEGQRWTAADGVDPTGLMAPHGAGHRLGHQPDGACAFLDPAGRCRIHAKFGADAKPLACRLFPVALHPVGRRVAVGLRFQCPSAAANQGPALSASSPELQRLAAEVVPAGFKGAPPAILDGPPGDWADVERFARRLDATLAAAGAPLGLRLRRALHWTDAVERANLGGIEGAGAEEILDALCRSAVDKTPAEPSATERPSRFGAVFFRMMVLEHARVTTVGDLARPGAFRWRMFWAGLRFAAGSGRAPDLGNGLRPATFASIEGVPAHPSAEAEAMLTRYFRMKAQTLDFCGPAFRGRPLIEGFRALALLYPIILWIGRWRAAGAGRAALSDEDVAAAVSLADHNHGSTPPFPWRIRLLSRRGDVVRLCR